jgi:hypothetical protein
LQAVPMWDLVDNEKLITTKYILKFFSCSKRRPDLALLPCNGYTCIDRKG